MIIYQENQPPLLSEYGIQIPMLKGRAERVKDELVKNFGEQILCIQPLPVINEEDLARVHTSEFLERCRNNPRSVVEETFELINGDGSYNRYDPASAKKELSELVALYRESCQASYLCLQEARAKGFAYYLGGGFHHALSYKGRGFCLFNDIMIALKKYQAEVQAGLVWVIDLDAHKGCGTAQIAQKDPTVRTLSIHMKDGWPLDSGSHDESGKLYPWYIPSSVDIGIAENEEKSYLSRLKQGLSQLEKLSAQAPIMAVVVDGSDPYEGDALPSADLLKLSREQCLERNTLVYDFLKARNVPQAYLMSGGYGDKNWIIHYQFIASVIRK